MGLGNRHGLQRWTGSGVKGPGTQGWAGKCHRLECGIFEGTCPDPLPWPLPLPFSKWWAPLVPQPLKAEDRHSLPTHCPRLHI